VRLFKRKPVAVFTGNCLVRQHTADGAYVGRCHHSTYDNVCHLHGNVATWLLGDQDDPATFVAWPNDFDLEGGD
jgi:hypothetical protein